MPRNGTNFAKICLSKRGGRVKFIQSTSVNVTERRLNDIDVLLGIFFVYLNWMKWKILNIGQKYYLFLADLAKFTKMLGQLWSATIKQINMFLFSILRSFR